MTRHFRFAIPLIVGGIWSCRMLQAQTTPPPDPNLAAFLEQTSKLDQSARQGSGLTRQEAAGLEDALAKSPTDVTARAKLLEYYFGTHSPDISIDERIRARRRNILWLIANQPDSPLLWASAATIDPRGQQLADPEGYQEAKELWLKQTGKSGVSAATLGCAGRFFYLPDKRLAAAYFARARQLQPQFPFWTAMQGSILAFAVTGITMMNQNGLPGPADPAEAGSDFAKSAMQELTTSDDADLLAAAAGELTMRGFMAQGMAKTTPSFDALVLAETVLNRAQKLKPDADYSAQFARIHKFRARSAAR